MGAKQRIVFLCSGGGGNLRFIDRALQAGLAGAFTVGGVFADRECPALAYAITRKIPNGFASDRQSFDAALRHFLGTASPDLIVTTVHKIIGQGTLDLYPRKWVNLHYSLLPAFKGSIGKKTIEEALSCGCKFVGTTVHYVNGAVDSGEIISQSVVPVEAGEKAENIVGRVFRSGCLNLLNAIRVIAGHGANGKPASKIVFTQSGDGFSPGLSFDPEIFDGRFWADLSER